MSLSAPMRRFLPPLLLILLAAAPVWRAVFLGEAIGPVDHVRTMLGGERATTPWNVLQADALLQFRVWRGLVFEGWAQGRVPAWNPYALLGTPLLANSQSGALYPPHILLGVARAPVDFAIGWLAWFHLALAGVGSYRLCRALGTDRASAFFGGSGFMFSAFLLAWTPLASVPTTVAWIPWLLFGIASRRHTTTIGAAAMMLSAGHLQFAAYGMLGGAVFAVGIGAWRTLPALAIGGVLAAAAILPALSFSQRSHRRAAPTEVGYAAYSRAAVQPWQLGVLGMPNADGTPQRFAPVEAAPIGGYWPSVAKIGENFAEAAIGISPAAFALLAAAPWRSRRTRAVAAVAASGLLLALPTVFSRLMYFGVPGWSATGSPGRAGVLFVLGGSVLAALGMSELRRRMERPRIVAAAGAGGLAIAVAFGANLFAPTDALGLGAAYDAWRAESLMNALPTAAAFVAATLLILAYAPARRWSVALAGFPALYALVTYAPGLDPTGPMPPALVSSPERVAVVNDRWSFFTTPPAIFPPNLLAAARVAEAGGYDSLVDRDTKRLLDAANGADSAPPENGNMMMIKPSASDGSLRALGVTERWERDPATGAISRRAIGGRMLEEGNWTAAPDGFLLRDLPARAIVFRQRNLPGWSVDGVPAAPGDWIAVPAGAAGRTVRLRYEPPGLRLGAILSGLGAGAAVLIAMADRRRGDRRNRDGTIASGDGASAGADSSE